MNPDKLFDYLDGKLPDWERHQVEEQLTRDPRLQEELAMARKIHTRSSGESREVLLPDEDATSARGRKLALRVGIAFIVLIALNVGLGLLFIAHKEASNPNRKLLEAQMREQLTKSLAQAARDELTPPPLGVTDITIAAARGQLNIMADEVVATAQRLGGSATKELPGDHRAGVLVDLPSNRESEFRAALAVMIGAVPISPSPATSGEQSSEKKSFAIQIVEPANAP
jgi:hypothetical protein